MKIDRLITLAFLGLAVVNALPALEALHRRYKDSRPHDPELLEDMPLVPPGYREAWREIADDLR